MQCSKLTVCAFTVVTKVPSSAPWEAISAMRAKLFMAYSK
jgi:hypothetical protein